MALIVFLAAGLTDGLDGFIAKRFNYVSTLGAILDPLADKLLIGSAYVMLTLTGDIPFWILTIVVFRDLVIVGGYLILVIMGDDMPMSPSYISKINTFLQIALVCVILIGNTFLFFIPYLTELIIVGVLTTTIISGVHYIWSWGIKHEYKQ